MEHNFNPNKGDYKYILEEERRKQTGEASAPPVSQKQKLNDRFWNWIIVRLLKRSSRSNNMKASFPVLLELFF